MTNISNNHDPQQVVTYKPYMAGLLKRLQSVRSLVSITIDNEKIVHNTIIIEVDSQRQCLYLDELNSDDAHKSIRKGSTIHFNARMQGVQIGFQTSVMSIETSDHIAMYQLAFPENMIYVQRRRHYRAAVNDEYYLGVSLPIPLKKHIIGSVVDISAGGFCTRLALAETNNIQEQQAIYDATLTLPGQNTITCDIEVRSIRRYPEHGYSLVGGEFIDIDAHKQTHVERVVAMLDRNQRRSANHA